MSEITERIIAATEQAWLEDLKAQTEYLRITMNQDNYPMEMTMHEDLSYTMRRADGKPFE